MGAGGNDRLLLEGMRFFGHHGDLEPERTLGSRLEVDVELRTDLSVAGRSDSLSDTIDYVRCFSLVRSLVEGEQYHLLEALAENIASALLRETDAGAVNVRVAKQPPIDGDIRRCAVVVDRVRGG